MPPRDKAEALADHLEREGEAPPYKFVTDGGFKLGHFWKALVGPRKQHKAAVEAVLATRPRPGGLRTRAAGARPRDH